QAELDLIARAAMLRVPLETRTLEVLDRVAVLGELLTDRVAEDVQPAVRQPEVLEAEAEEVAGLWEVPVRVVVLIGLIKPDRRERRMVPPGRYLPSHQTELHPKVLRVFGVPLEPRALKVLHAQPVLTNLLGDREPEDVDPAVTPPEVQELGLRMMARLGEVDDPFQLLQRRRGCAHRRATHWQEDQ